MNAPRAPSSSSSRPISSRATSPRWKRSITPSPSTWRWAARPTPILHTLAIAREAGIAYDIKRIDDISRRVPCLCKVSPSSNYHVQDVHRAGGIHTILGELKRMGALTPTCKTVTGKTIGENIDEWDVRSEKCTAWAKASRVAGCSARSCSTRTTSSAPPPAPPAATWRPSRCCSSPATRAASRSGAWPRPSMSSDAATAAALFAEDAEFQVDDTTTWKGPAAIEAGLKQKFAEFKGLRARRVGATQGHAGAGDLAIRQGRARRRSVAWCARAVCAAGKSARPITNTGPAQIKEAQPAASCPTTRRSCSTRRTASARRTPPTPRMAAWPSSTASSRPRAAWSRPPASATSSRRTAARASSSKAPA